VAVEQDGIGFTIFELDNLGRSKKHNGGHIHFGNDDKLYIPVGDNKRDRFGPILYTMKLTNLFGKVLRIKRRTARSPQTTRSSSVPPARIRPFGPGAFATPSASRSSPLRATGSTSTTWASIHGRR
jgi:hypothetical protein